MKCKCCDWKARAESVQSFTLWQQAIMEMTCYDHSIIACTHHLYMVLFFTHISFMMNRTFNATPPERLQQHPLLFTTNCTDLTFFLQRLQLARLSYPGHSTILLQSESPCGKCAKFCTVAASNNKISHTAITLRVCWSLRSIVHMLVSAEITSHDQSVVACSCHLYMGVVLRVHAVHDESHIQRNVSEEVATQATSSDHYQGQQRVNLYGFLFI